MKNVQKPVKRSKLRKKLGKEYYILKRNIRYAFGSEKWATKRASDSLNFPVFQHKSVLLRKLKNVDMWLQENKVVNLQIATSKISGVLIKPGETFSIWKLVGRTSKHKGYKTGMILENGNISQGTGGGLCQLGNLLYWMVLHSPLTVVERWRHSYDVFPDVNRTIPFGCGATLSYNYIDLLVKNDTSQTFQINLWLDDEYLNGELLSNTEPTTRYAILETHHEINHQWWGGYTRHNRIERKVTDMLSNTETQELVAENHAIMMYNPMLSE